MSAPNPSKLLGERLLEAKLISSQQLDLALREQRRTGKLIGETLQSLGFISEHDVSRFLAHDAHTETVDVRKLEIDPPILALIPVELAKEHVLIPIRREGNTLTIAMADPFDVIAISSVEQHTRLNVEVLSAVGPAILEKINQVYVSGQSAERAIEQLMKIETDSGLLEDAAPMITLVEQILSDGVKRGASDIHFEPDEKNFRIRMRVDGILQDYLLVPKDLQDSVIARIKVMAHLDVSETRLPQDGRMTLTLVGKRISLRVSALPTNFGESVVLRILDTGDTVMTIAKLGLSPRDTKCLIEAVAAPHGIVLVTGPTGSGKTTTLYAALNQVNVRQRSVFTLEDPIEYTLPYTRQTQIHERIGLTFANGLRTLLRQDPDVLLVGETRDQETAQLMTRAALTGHLVLSSLHTNDAVAAIPRLIDLGVEPFLLSSTLRLIIAQRLVRRLCVACRHPAPNSTELISKLPFTCTPTEGQHLWRAQGCPACGGTGYRGRLAIFEMLALDGDFERLVIERDTNAILALAKKKGMTTLAEDGVGKALLGLTTLEEVYRVAL